MGKRGFEGGDKRRQKKFKLNHGVVEPAECGIYATCPKFKGRACLKELGLLFDEKALEFYPEMDLEADGEESEELSIEDAIKKEVAEMKDESKEARKLQKFSQVDLGCECLVFIKCRKPIVPSEFVMKLCEESLKLGSKSTRFTQRLSPIDLSCSATIDEVKKMAIKVLKPHFHLDSDQKPWKFAIVVNKRNFNQLEKMDIIKTIAACVGNENGHKVDLKQYDKLILVECFKSNVGMSVVEKYDELCKFNLQQIFEKQLL